MAAKKSFSAGRTKNGTLSNAGQALRSMEARKTWKLDYIHRENLMPNDLNKRYPQNGIAALAESIKRQGLMQNLDVIPAGNGKYRIIAGERRYRAIMSLTEEEYASKFPSGVPAKIEDQTLDQVDEEIMLIEANYLGRGDGLEHGADVPAEARFASYSNMKRWEIGRLKELYKIKDIGLSAVQINDKIAGQLNISSRQVYNYLSVNKLIPELDEMFTSGRLTMKQGSKIGNLPEDAQMEVYHILSESGKISDGEIRIVKGRAKEREEAFSRIEAELAETRSKMRQQEAAMEVLDGGAKSSAGGRPDPEGAASARDRLQDGFDMLQARYASLRREKERMRESLRQLTPEDTAKAKAQLQISQSISGIRSSIAVLEKNRDYIAGSGLLADLESLRDDLDAFLSGI